jgi:hypothetical protein
MPDQASELLSGGQFLFPSKTYLWGDIVPHGGYQSDGGRASIATERLRYFLIFDCTA